jgi:hypothetical protein
MISRAVTLVYKVLACPSGCCTKSYQQRCRGVSDTTFSCFVAGIVVKVGFVGGLGANTDKGHGLLAMFLL